MTPAFKGDTRAILSPKSDFFRYFTTPTPVGRRRAVGEAPAAK